MSADRLSLWLAAGIAGTLGLALLPWLPEQARGAAPAMPPPAETARAMPASLPSLDNLPETRARPPFAPDRRPAPGAMAPANGGHRLVGIIGSAGNRRALLRHAAETRSVGEGDRIDDWTVQAIEIERIVLERTGERLILSIGATTPVDGVRGGSQ